MVTYTLQSLHYVVDVKICLPRQMNCKERLYKLYFPV